MNTGYLNGDDWDTLLNEYPDAYHFLLRQALRHELEHLRNTAATLNAWQTERLAELEQLLLDTDL